MIYLLKNGVFVRMALRKKFFYFLFFLFFCIIVLFGTKIYLVLNLLIGHDSLVRLTASDQDLFLSNSESSEIEFSSYVSSNPFCKSFCEYDFRDLSSGEVLDKGNFSTVISNPHSKKYTLYAPDKGVGQKLYRFGVSCVSGGNSFCKTEGLAIEKSFIVSLNYNLSDGEEILRGEAVDRLNEIINGYMELEFLYFENLYLRDILEEEVFILENGSFNLSNVLDDVNESLDLFEVYDYEGVLRNNVNLSNETLVYENVFLEGMINRYNDFVYLVGEEEGELGRLVLEENMSEDDFENISLLIKEYNNFVDSLNYSFNVDSKIFEIQNLIILTDEIYSSLDRSSGGSLILDEINSFPLNFLVINFSMEPSVNLSIPTEASLCSYGGVVESCCDASCATDSLKYPVILLHGHSFNSGISAEKSLGDLQGIRARLFSDRFLDGGDLILKSGDTLETFRKTRERVVFSGSYYFDIYQNSEETVILETQSDSLDSYALRLSELIDEVKAETGKDKVVIVAHSMGGLVARKYLQIFGDDDVFELIMIGTPNHGINGTTLSGCSILGEAKHCDDMDWKSLFMNKLNYGRVPNIPVKNIIGIGCDMDGEDGDGIVVNSSAYLSWADNYYVNGSCMGFEYLHTDLVRPAKAGAVYDLVYGFLMDGD
jgi:pimeloyl-ACP methyl ester carboxylesterase